MTEGPLACGQCGATPAYESGGEATSRLGIPDVLCETCIQACLKELFGWLLAQATTPEERVRLNEMGVRVVRGTDGKDRIVRLDFLPPAPGDPEGGPRLVVECGEQEMPEVPDKLGQTLGEFPEQS